MAPRPRPVWLLMLAAALVYGALAVLAVRLLGLPEKLAAPAVLAWVVGGLLALLGMALAGWAIRHLSLRRAFGGEIDAPAATSTLVTTGPYALVRNPLYVGVLVALAGWTLALRSTIVALVSLCMAAHLVAMARWEQRELAARFGSAYEAYRRATRAFLPSYRPRRS